MARTTRLASFEPVFVITACYLSLRHVSCRLHAIQTINTSQHKKMKNFYKKNLQVQTTLDASFGPVFVTTAYHPTLRHISCRFRLVSIKEDKKKHTYGPNNASRIVWACFHHHRMLSLSPSRILQITSYIDNKILVSIKKDEEIFKKNTYRSKQRVWSCLGPFSSPLHIIQGWVSNPTV